MKKLWMFLIMIKLGCKMLWNKCGKIFSKHKVDENLDKKS